VNDNLSAVNDRLPALTDHLPAGADRLSAAHDPSDAISALSARPKPMPGTASMVSARAWHEAEYMEVSRDTVEEHTESGAIDAAEIHASSAAAPLDAGRPMEAPEHLPSAACEQQLQRAHRARGGGRNHATMAPMEPEGDSMSEHDLGSHPPFGCPTCGAELTLVAASDFHEIAYDLDGPLVSVPRKNEWTCANGHRLEMQMVETYDDEPSVDGGATDQADGSAE
jgi:hypothetical protein